MQSYSMEIEDIIVETDLGKIILPSQKIYDFILQLNAEGNKRSDIRNAAIEEYFDGEDFGSEYYNLTHFKVPSYLKCMWDIINRDYEIVKLTNYNHKSLSEKPPKGYDFSISLTEKEHLLMDCVVFLKCKETGDKLVLSLMPYNDGDKFFLDIESTYSVSGVGFRGFWTKVKEYFNTQGPLKNAVFNTGWDYVDFHKRGWDSIVISDDYKQTINRNIVKFIENIDTYKTLRLPTSRGVLITGPPGTGKTLLCETIISQVECTKIYVTSDSVSNVGDIQTVYKVARKLAPTIVIIEDIDTLGGLDRRERGNHPLLGEFLNCLNGVGDNEGVVTLATTNYPKHLDVALVDRPGRIDLRIDFGLPDNHLREHIYKKYLSELECEKINYDQLAKKSEGMSGAYIREVVMTAYLISQETGSKITNATMLESLMMVERMRSSLNPTQNPDEHYHI